MAQRLSVHHVPSDDVQGEGSWVAVKRITVDQYDQHNRRMIAARKSENQEEADRLETETRQFYASVLIDWNWVDDEGAPLPNPHNNPGILQSLTMDELNFLTSVILMGGGEKKALTNYTKKP